MVKRPREDTRVDKQHYWHPPKSPKTHHHAHNGPAKPYEKQISIDDKISSLDAKYPAQGAYAKVPAFTTSKRLPSSPASTSLPPLPPVSEALSLAPFTHGSFIDTKYGTGTSSTYERLEFLGDAYVEIMATRLIYARFPHLITGKLAKLRENLIRNSTLARFANSYGFGDKVRMDNGNRAKFGIGQPGQDKLRQKEGTAAAWEKVLADMFEAYVAAAVLSDDENGFAVVEDWLTKLWVEILLETDQDTTLEVVQNRKEELANLIGGRDVRIEYAEERPMTLTADKSRQQNYIAVYITGWGYKHKRLGGGVGVGKTEAGMRAAANALDNNKELVDKIADVKRKADADRRARMAKEREEANNSHANGKAADAQ